MKIYRDLTDFTKKKKSVVTVGTFDGLHKGHIKILDTLKKIAEDVDGSTVLVTFEPHPRSVISKDYDLKMLMTPNEKEKLLHEFGIENLIVINFTNEFSQLTSDQFIKNYIVDKINTAHMVIGHDHKFGKDRLGDELKLREVGKQFGFDVTSVPPETINGEIISSTIIRNSLFDGNIEKANFLIGRNYFFSGEVVKGAQRGKMLGFPTANFKLDFSNKAVPKKGVYIVMCQCEDQTHYGIMNIGLRPTFEDRSELVIEVHLLNFDRDIYGKTMNVNFLNRLRDERKFNSIDELIHQIEEDKRKAMELIKVLVN